MSGGSTNFVVFRCAMQPAQHSRRQRSLCCAVLCSPNVELFMRLSSFESSACLSIFCTVRKGLGEAENYTFLVERLSYRK